MTAGGLQSCKGPLSLCSTRAPRSSGSQFSKIKTSCVPSRCEASTGRMASCPLVYTLSRGSVRADDTTTAHIRGAQAARSQIQKCDKMSCENLPNHQHHAQVHVDKCVTNCWVDKRSAKPRSSLDRRQVTARYKGLAEILSRFSSANGASTSGPEFIFT